jgi:hypothetical protein
MTSLAVKLTWQEFEMVVSPSTLSDEKLAARLAVVCEPHEVDRIRAYNARGHRVRLVPHRELPPGQGRLVEENLAEP